MKPDSSCDSGCEVERFSLEIDGDEAVSQVKVSWSSPECKSSGNLNDPQNFALF